MSRAPTIVVRCAFCPHVMTLFFDNVKIPARAVRMPAVKCPACDSRFEVEISTKRKSKGARLKAAEARARAEHASRVAVRERENEVAAAGLLKTKGCTCAERVASGWDNLPYYKRSLIRPDGLDASQSHDRDNLPNPPRHCLDCPLSEYRRRHAANPNPEET